MNNAGSSDWSAHVKVTTTSMYMYIVLIKSRCESESVLSASIFSGTLGPFTFIPLIISAGPFSWQFIFVKKWCSRAQWLNLSNHPDKWFRMQIVFISIIVMKCLYCLFLPYIVSRKSWDYCHLYQKLKLVDHYLTSLWVCMNCKLQLNIQNYRNLICVSFKLLSFI